MPHFEKRVDQKTKTMKKTLIVLSFVASLLLLGCGCDRFKKGSNTPPESPQVDDKGIAFEIFERIPKEDLNETFREKTYSCPDGCHRHFGDYVNEVVENEMFSMEGDNSFSVNCFPLNSGGWMTLLVNQSCFDRCNQTVKTYLYKDGLLSFVSDVLPHPSMDEMVADPFLVCDVDPEELEAAKRDWNNRYLYGVKGEDTLTVGVETFFFNEMLEQAILGKQYVWNGESFAEIAPAQDATFNIIDYDGLGSLKLGGTLPDPMVGFSKSVADDGLLFSRDGREVFKAHLNGEGVIEAISIYAKEYTHQGLKVGDTLNMLAQKPGLVSCYKDGNFVVTDGRGVDNCRIDYVGPKDAMNGTFVEGPIEDPKFKPDATVQYIRIYKYHDWENDTCDMHALREALENAMLFNGDPIYGENHFEYYRELYNEECQGWCDAFHSYLHCYPLKSGGFKVYETTDWQPGIDTDAEGYTKFSAYIYKDGVLTEVEPEPELNAFSIKEDGIHFVDVMGAYFYDRSMTVATGETEDGKLQGVEFTWDGTTMKKTYEGTFEN
jgi:hypothetical protein